MSSEEENKNKNNRNKILLLVILILLIVIVCCCNNDIKTAVGNAFGNTVKNNGYSNYAYMGRCNKFSF